MLYVMCVCKRKLTNPPSRLYEYVIASYSPFEFLRLEDECLKESSHSLQQMLLFPLSLSLSLLSFRIVEVARFED